MTEKVLAVNDLTMHYMTRKGPVFAVDGVTFHVDRGEAIGLVGESGCGKTSIAISLLKLLPNNAKILNGEIRINDTDVVPLTDNEMNKYRWKDISMVFQAAMNSMNPVYTVEEQILEAMRDNDASASACSCSVVLFGSVSSGGIWKYRKTDPFFGGVSTISVAAVSAVPSFLAGVSLVRHRSVKPRSG